MQKKSSRLKLHRETLASLEAAVVRGGVTGIQSACDICIPPTEYITCWTCPEDS